MPVCIILPCYLCSLLKFDDEEIYTIYNIYIISFRYECTGKAH